MQIIADEAARGLVQAHSQTVLSSVFDDTSARDPRLGQANEEDYRVKLPVFEGPLDLLLHLIRREQLNIYDIPVAQICQTYMDHLDLLMPDCNVAGEFFVMAATLLHLKSAVLLPKEESEEAEDPRMPLVAQLLEYERFKKAAQELDKRDWLERELYLRPAAALDMPVESLLDAPIASVDPFQLLVCLKSSLDRTHRVPIKIEIDTTSLKEKVIAVGNMLDSSEVIEFSHVAPRGSRVFEIIMSFMAVLELARMKYVEILQTENFGPIQIRRVRSVRDLNLDLLDQF